MSSKLRKLERAFLRINQARRSATRLEVSTALLKAALEMAILVAFLYLTGEIVAVIWRLAQNFTVSIIPLG